MSLGRGTKAVMAAIIEATYGTPLAMTGSGTNNANLIPFLNETFSKEFARQTREWLDGSASPAADRQGVQSIPGSITARMVYDEKENTNQGYGVGLLLALASQCGLRASTYAATGYNRYTPANDHAYFITCAFDKDQADWTCVSVKCTRFRIYGNVATGKVMIDMDFQAYDLRAFAQIGSTGVAGPDHNFTALRAVFTTEPTPVSMSELTLRLGDRSNVLTSSDNVQVGEFDLTVTTGLSDNEYTTPSSAGEDTTMPIEPEGGAKHETTLGLRLPRYSSDTIAGWHEDDTALQAEFEFNYSASRKLWLRFPNLVLPTWAAPVSGAGVVPQNLNLIARRPNGNDTMHATTHKFEDGSQELVDENGIHVDWGIETLDDRAASPMAI